MPPEQNNPSPVPSRADDFGKAPHGAADDGSVPQVTAPFRTAPQDAAVFRNQRQAAARSENHTLTVKEVARMFEAAGEARIERTIVNWCQPNRHGVARLDAYFDPNERRYLITAQSVDRAIKEEIAKGARRSESAEALGDAANSPESESKSRKQFEDGDAEAMADLRFKLRESEISSRVKDQVIAKLEKRYDDAHDKLLNYSRTLGQLETRLLQLEGPTAKAPELKRVQVISESEYSDSETQGGLS